MGRRMTDSLTVALIQREITPHDPAGNLLATLDMLHRCADQQVDLFVLSELWATGLVSPTDQSSTNLAESPNGPSIEALREFCAGTQSYLLAGTLALKGKNGLRNTSLLIGPTGEIILEYSKIHLFHPMGEEAIFDAGTTLEAAEVKAVGVGVVICCDIRFPALVRALARAGCEVILVPALWPEERINHWETLLRARAIENQVYIVGANGLANQNGIFFPGHSMIVGPAGEALNSPEMRESAIVRKLDLRKLRKMRSELCYLDEEIEVRGVHWSSKVNETKDRTV